MTTPPKGEDGCVNTADDDDNDDNHEELLVVPFQHTVSISDTAVEMASILCYVLLLLSVMTQHLHSHWYFLKSIDQSQSHYNSDGIVFKKDTGRICCHIDGSLPFIRVCPCLV